MKKNEKHKISNKIIITIIIIIISLWTWLTKVWYLNNFLNIEILSSWEKILNNECEKSWWKILFTSCNTIWCSIESHCSCLLENSSTKENELNINDSKFLLKKWDICTPCLKDSDCWSNSCKNIWNVNDVVVWCEQKNATCENGICHKTRIYNYYDNIYKCMDNNCKIKNNKIAYIKSFISDKNTYKNWEDILWILKIKNITNSNQTYKVFMTLKSLDSKKIILTKSGSITLKANFEDSFRMSFPTNNINVFKDWDEFQLSVDISKVGNYIMDNRFLKVIQKEYVIIKSINVTNKISKNLSDYQLINIKMSVENPTNKTFRAYARFYVNNNNSNNKVLKWLQRFIDFKPFETKELKEFFRINELSPWYYNVNAKVNVGNFSVDSDFKNLEITD